MDNTAVIDETILTAFRSELKKHIAKNKNKFTPVAEWVNVDLDGPDGGFIHVYIWFANTLIPYNNQAYTTKALVICNISVYPIGEGIGPGVLSIIEEECPFNFIKMENLVNPTWAEKIKKLGWIHYTQGKALHAYKKTS